MATQYRCILSSLAVSILMAFLGQPTLALQLEITPAMRDLFQTRCPMITKKDTDALNNELKKIQKAFDDEIKKDSEIQSGTSTKKLSPHDKKCVDSIRDLDQLSESVRTQAENLQATQNQQSVEALERQMQSLAQKIDTTHAACKQQSSKLKKSITYGLFALSMATAFGVVPAPAGWIPRANSVVRNTYAIATGDLSGKLDTATRLAKISKPAFRATVQYVATGISAWAFLVKVINFFRRNKKHQFAHKYLACVANQQVQDAREEMCQNQTRAELRIGSQTLDQFLFSQSHPKQPYTAQVLDNRDSLKSLASALSLISDSKASTGDKTFCASTACLWGEGRARDFNDLHLLVNSSHRWDPLERLTVADEKDPRKINPDRTIELLRRAQVRERYLASGQTETRVGLIPDPNTEVPKKISEKLKSWGEHCQKKTPVATCEIKCLPNDSDSYKEEILSRAFQNRGTEAAPAEAKQ